MKRTIEERLLNPKPVSKIAEEEFGIDLTLLIGTLRLTPNQRVKNLQRSMRNVEKLRRDAESWRKNNRDRNSSGT